MSKYDANLYKSENRPPVALTCRSALLGCSLRRNVDYAIEIGRLLTERKESFGHGEWLPWLQANVELSRDTADNYRWVYNNQDN